MAGTPAKNRDAHAKAKRSTSNDRDVLREGHLRKFSRSPLPRTEPRYVMLTETHLHWFKGESWGLMGERVGSMPIKDILKVKHIHKQHAPGFEVVGRYRRRWVFLTESEAERDHWVWAIANARGLSDSTDPSEASEGETKDEHERPVDRASDERAMAVASVKGGEGGAAGEVELDAVQLVTCMTGTGEVVVWRRTRGTEQTVMVHLPPGLGTKDEVLLWLGSGSHVLVRGTSIAQSLQDGQASQEMCPYRRTALTLAFTCLHPPAPWFRHPEVALAALALTALAVLRVPWVGVLAVVPVTYVVVRHCMDSEDRKLGQVRMKVTTRPVRPPHPPHHFQQQHHKKHEDEANPLSDASRPAALVPLPASRSLRTTSAWYQEKPAPRMFVEACHGDVAEAVRRWQAVRKWRDEFHIDTILQRPHPHFHAIKRHWPDLFLGHARNGDVVYLDRTSKIKFPLLLAEGLNVDDLCYHVVWMTEFLMEHLMSDARHTRLIMIYDLRDGRLVDFTPQTLVLLKKVASLLQQCYQGRERAVLFINVPSFFPLLWTLIKPAFNESLRQLMHVASKADTYKLLTRYLDPQDIPSEYGGEMKYEGELDENRHLFHNETRFVQHINAVNESSAGRSCTMPLRVTHA